MRVVMLSQNEWRHDSRVIRESEALARLGHEVHVVCRAPLGAPTGDERVDNVRYLSIPRKRLERPTDVVGLFQGHMTVLRLDASRALSGPRPARSLVSALRLLGMFVVAPLAILALAVIRLFPGGFGGRHGGRRLLDYLEAIRYLNDYASACSAAVVDVQPDVVHAHDLVTLSAGVIAAQRTGARLVYDAHELETHTNYHLLPPIAKRWIAHYESVLIQTCDEVITVCDSIADWLAREYAIDRPVVVMNSPKLDTKPRHDGSSLRTTLDLAPSVPLVVYVGSVTVDRGLELAVEALPLLPGVHLATVGRRYNVTENGMRRVAEANGVSDRVHFVDPVPSASVVSFIADADASVIPIQNVCLSYAFSFPNKLLESVFAGVPVAAANLVEIRKFLEAHPVGLLMDETDPHAIAAALRELIARREDFAPDEMELQRIDADYGWDVQQARLFALYERLAGGTPTPAVSERMSLSKLAS
jgi:glycosyltransferase involved in cell wall biosynthesis